MTFIVATNVIDSRPPEHRPTGTPHARAKSSLYQNESDIANETKIIGISDIL